MSNISIRSFAAGELAPALHARTDLARYEVGLRQCRNWLIMRQGGATKRPGTLFVGEVRDSSKKVRLIPFLFNIRQTFVLEFGEEYVRFFTNGSIVVDPSDNISPLEIASPYATADLPDLQYVQSGDVITIVHNRYPPYELKRLSNTNWTLTPIVFGPTILPPEFTTVAVGGDPGKPSPAYVVTAINAAGDESLQSGPITPVLGGPSTTFPVSFSGSTTTDAVTVRVYRQDGGSGVFGFIGEGIVTDAAFVWFDFGTIPELTLQPPIDKSSALFASANNYPSVVAYYQQRLIFANSNAAPDTVWTSRTALYHNFNTSAIVQDDDAITFRLVSDEVDAIRHIINLGRLLIGTEGADWIVEGDGNGTLTPIAVNARVGSYDGMATLRPIKTGARMLFVQAMGSAVRELQSDVQFGTYSLTGDDVTVYASHLVDGYSIVDWSFQQEPLHIAWLVRSDGSLLSLTYVPDQEQLGWARHDTDGYVENVAVVPEGRAHFLYLVVRRIVDGQTRRYVERMTTTNITPVYATPEEAANAPGGINTPPPPPDDPGPSSGPIVPPSAPSTTDIGTTGATANWVAGNITAPTEIGYRLQGGSDTSWITTTISGGLQSLPFTGLTAGTAYEWRARHVLSGSQSPYLGPSAGTQFTTLAETQALAAPTAGPTLSGWTGADGFTDAVFAFPASPQDADADLYMAGPNLSSPTDDDYTLIGGFSPGVTTAEHRFTLSGFYWFRVRYTKTGFAPSPWSDANEIFIGINNEV